MSSADLHPEDLLDRVRRGQATAVERERVDAHLASCAVCRFEQAVLVEGMRDASPQAGDAARARAIEQAALTALAERGLLGSSKGRRRAGAWIAAIAASSIATAAAAAVITHPPWLERLIPMLATREAPKPVTPQPQRRVAEVAPQQVVAPMPAPELEPVVEREATPSPSGASEKRSAAELFAAANEARRDRSMSQAVRLYRALARLHPRAPQTQVARVALGRLLLDRADDPRGALQQFDAYLEDRSQQSLREEAMIGRALALSRLGRSHEERAAWQTLLDAYPSSASADRAKARLRAE